MQSTRGELWVAGAPFPTPSALCFLPVSSRSQGVPEAANLRLPIHRQCWTEDAPGALHWDHLSEMPLSPAPQVLRGACWEKWIQMPIWVSFTPHPELRLLLSSGLPKSEVFLWGFCASTVMIIAKWYLLSLSCMCCPNIPDIHTLLKHSLIKCIHS